MTTVYNVDNEEDSLVIELKQELIDSDNGNNTDMHIIFQGYLHSKSGFRLRIENIEVFDGDLIHTWQKIVESKGMQADVTADLSNAWVEITCKRARRHRKSIRDKIHLPSFSTFKFPTVPLMLLVYICICIASIIILWQRHKEKFLK